MNKTARIVLYVLSILTVTGVIAAVVAFGGKETSDKTTEVTAEEKKSTEEVQQSKTSEGQDINTKQEEQSGIPEISEAETSETEVSETDGETTIFLTGDVLFANAFKAGYDASGIQGVIAEDLLQELNAADILMVNNEFPFSDRGMPMENKQFTFRCSPSYVTALQEMGTDIVSLANNHTLDYGKEALSDTFTTLDQADILYAGAGDTVERAEELQVIEVNGKKIGFLAVSRVIPEAGWKVENSTPGIFSCYDDTRLTELVKEAKETCDFLAVYPHWGVEYKAYPENYQEKIAQNCMKAGADVIVGSHTHCLQGVSYIDGKPVFYSLGNFIFGQNIDRSAILKITIAADGKAAFQLIPVCAAGGVTQYPDKAGAEDICEYLDRISDGAKISVEGMVTQE